MSERYPGGIISKTAPTPSGPYQNSTAPGVWTLDQATNYIKAGNWPTAGNVDPNAYIDNLFSTYLYTGNGSTQTINNGLNLSANGGLVWTKSRNSVNGDYYHCLTDTTRGNNKVLFSNTTSAQSTYADGITAFNSNGFSLGTDASGFGFNVNGTTFASWTFRKQSKFFDVVTYTGDGVAGRTVAHNLGSAPGMIIVKCTSASVDWVVYHRSANGSMYLNLTTQASAGNLPFFFGNNVDAIAPTSTNFTVGASGNYVNANGQTYVAYLFAHDAGGFGLSGTDNVISCGSYTGNSSAAGPIINLGYEPQFLLVKNTSSSGNWFLLDNMRNLSLTGYSYILANSTASESNGSGGIFALQATGFQPTDANSAWNGSGQTYIYMAVRRPMQPPTLGTQVFSPNATTASVNTFITTNFPIDLQIQGGRPGFSTNQKFIDRLRGVGTIPSTTSNTPYISSALSDAETSGNFTNGFNNTGFQIPSVIGGLSMVYWNFRRASGFFDEVVADRYNYDVPSLTGFASHNLGVQPEMMILKARDTTDDWFVYHSGINTPTRRYVKLNTTDAQSAQSNIADPYWVFNGTTGFRARNMIGGSVATAANSVPSYLFATCPNVSKVGSYTGTGATQTINCGFTGGARFVLIKRTDSTGDWYVWDTARGMVAGTDPKIPLNSTAAETNANWVYTATTGFQIVTTDASVNANGGSYIFLAIA